MFDFQIPVFEVHIICNTFIKSSQKHKFRTILMSKETAQSIEPDVAGNENSMILQKKSSNLELVILNG